MAGVNGLKTGVKEFIEDFNEYIAKLNKENKSLNLIASLGYLLASLTAIFSFVQEY